MSDQKSARRWFRFQLSTALLLVFVAGGMLGVNVVSRQDRAYFPLALDSEEAAQNSTQDFGHYRVRGWPFQFWEGYDGTSLVVMAEQFVTDTRFEPLERTDYGPLTADIFITLLIAAVVVVPFEYWMRQKAVTA